MNKCPAREAGARGKADILSRSSAWRDMGSWNGTATVDSGVKRTRIHGIVHNGRSGGRDTSGTTGRGNGGKQRIHRGKWHGNDYGL